MDVLIFFIVLTALLHVVLICIIKISSLTWKMIDYLWYVAAVIGIVLLCHDTAEKDLNAQSDEIEHALSISGQELSKNIFVLLQDTRCSEVHDAVNSVVEDHFLITPNENVGELYEFCTLASTLRQSMDLWLHNPNWPDLDDTVWTFDQPREINTYSLRQIVDLFEKFTSRYKDRYTTESLEDYSKALIFGGGNTSLLSDMLEDLDHWIETQEALENVRYFGWASNNWYWVIAFAAAFRITKIWGEITNERRSKAQRGITGSGGIANEAVRRGMPSASEARSSQSGILSGASSDEDISTSTRNATSPRGWGRHNAEHRGGPWR